VQRAFIGIYIQTREAEDECNRYDGEDVKYVEMIERDILDSKLSTKWDDIAKLDDAKRLLRESARLCACLKLRVRVPYARAVLSL
jgi:hypothetical protein